MGDPFYSLMNLNRIRLRMLLVVGSNTKGTTMIAPKNMGPYPNYMAKLTKKANT